MFMARRGDDPFVVDYLLSLARSLSLSLRFACRVVLVFSKNRIDLRIAVLLCTWPRGKFDVFFFK